MGVSDAPAGAPAPSSRTPPEIVTVTAVTASEPSPSSPPVPESAKPADTKPSERSRLISCAAADSLSAGAVPWVAEPASSSTASTTMVVVASLEPVAEGSVMSLAWAVIFTPDRSTSLSSTGASSVKELEKSCTLEASTKLIVMVVVPPASLTEAVPLPARSLLICAMSTSP